MRSNGVLEIQIVEPQSVSKPTHVRVKHEPPAVIRVHALNVGSAAEVVGLDGALGGR